MTIIEAFQTGLPVRRPTLKFAGVKGDSWVSRTYAVNNLLTVADVLADDWEVLEKKDENSDS